MRCDCQQESSVTRGTVRVTVSFDPDGLTLRHTPFGVVVDLADAPGAGDVGAPSLPRRVIRVAVPPLQWPTRLEIEHVHVALVTDEPVLVAPVQPLRAGLGDASSGATSHDERHGDSCCCQRRPHHGPSEFPEPFPAPAVVPPDVALYDAAVRTPRPLARALGIETSGLARVALIELNPVRIDPNGRLELCTQLDLVLSYSEVMPLADRDASHRELVQRLGRDIDPARLAPQPEPVITSAAHAKRLYDIARTEVVNPNLLVDISRRWPELDLPAEYLIITDDWTWNASTVTPVLPRPGMVAAFGRLATWKRSRGISTRVVTITDIVGGRYGSFRSGARDLQEVIRRFLKDVVPRWGVSWLLLGGDVDVVPIRTVAGALEGSIRVAAAEPPADNTSFWTGTFLKMHVVSPGIWWGGGSAMNILVNPATGARIPYDPTGASNATTAGWYFTTTDSYTTRTATPTNFVRVNGPAAAVNTWLRWLYQWNSLPTDLYYASLTSFVVAYLTLTGPMNLTFIFPYVYFPPHDWDALDNGVYGQHNGDGDLDGVVLTTDVSVGRAPVDSATQADTFVAKVIAYEGFRAPDGGSLDGNWPRRLLLAASNWGGGTLVTPTASNPPADGRYYHGPSSLHALIKLAAPPSDFAIEVVSEISDSDRRVMPYDAGAVDGGRGWHFARGASDLRPNGISIPLPFVGTIFFPLPSAWIVVYGTTLEVTPPSFLVYVSAQDGSMSDQEQLREQLRSEIPGWDTVSRLYEDALDLTLAQRVAAPVQFLTSNRLQSALNAAPHIVSLSGHGNSGGCCGGSPWMASGLTNGYHTFIGYADSCLTNQVDADDAFSEALLCAPNGGAVAYVGNTRFSWIGVGDDFQRAFFHRLTAVRQIGLANDSRLGLVGTTGYHTLYERWAIFALNLLGDPEMQLYRSRRVRRFVVKVSDAYARAPIVVHVEEMQPPTPIPFPEPPANVRVSIRQGDLTVVAQTDATGDAHFDLSAFARGAIEVTASHDDFATHRLQATITGPDWVRGTVSEIAHRAGSGSDTEVRLCVDGENRRFVARAELVDYRVILDALTHAFGSTRPIELLVSSVEDGGSIERFRLSGGECGEQV